MAASAQDMLRYVDLTSPAMTTAEMTRADVEGTIAKASASAPADFSGKRLNGLDLSGLSTKPGCLTPISPARASRRRPCSARRCSARINGHRPELGPPAVLAEWIRRTPQEQVNCSKTRKAA
jgi:hypothetical protein